MKIGEKFVNPENHLKYIMKAIATHSSISTLRALNAQVHMVQQHHLTSN